MVPKRATALAETDPTSSAWKALWLREGLCNSEQEADAVWEDFAATLLASNNDTSQQQYVADAMIEYFGISEEACLELLGRSGLKDEEDDNDSCTSGNEQSNEEDKDEGENALTFLDDDDEGEEAIGEGECSLCERCILISRHHLIPKCIWPRLEARMLNAATALEDDDTERAALIAGSEFEHLIPYLAGASVSSGGDVSAAAANKRARVRHALQLTANVCRPCHTAIHRTHDNWTLAWQYNTLDKILADPAIYKFSKWASQQKAGRFRRDQVAGGNGGIPQKKSKRKAKLLK